MALGLNARHVVESHDVWVLIHGDGEDNDDIQP
jgi:hypothetical protein